MDQDNPPISSNEPHEPPRESAKKTPAPGMGAQIYSAPSSGPFAPPPVQTAAPAPANNARRIWITVLIVLLVLCCCCFLIGVLGWFYGDQVLCNIDPSFGTCPVP